MWRPALLALALATALAAHPAGAQTLTYAQNVAVTAMDTAGPTIGTVYPAGYEGMFLVYDGLVRFNEKMQIEPQLAAEWSTSADGRTWTFKLRRGVTFHDGTPFDADAVVFHVQRQIDPKGNASNRPLWDPIASVRKVDDHTVAITTHRPYGALLNTLAHGSGGVVSPDGVKKHGANFKLNPVGAGPYMLEKWDVGSEVAFKRFDGYWGGKAAYARIVFRHVPDPSTRLAMLQSGQADVVNAVPLENVAQLQAVPAVDVITRPALRTFGFGLNLNRKAFQDVRVRRALNHAVDRGAIIKAVFRGFATPIDSPLSPFTTGYAPVGTYDFSPEKAKALLADAGWKPGADGVLRKDGEAFEVSVLTPQGMLPKDLEVTQAFQGFLQKVGVKATINKVEPAAFWDHLRVPPDKIAWDMVLFGFNPSNGDGGYHLTSLFASNPSRTERPKVWNFTWYSNPKVDSLLAEADQTVDPAKRKPMLVEAAKLAWDEAPYVWLYAENVVIAKRKDVKQVEVQPVIFTILRSAHP
ncbi:MAG: ABC transporter substrate-binding protein [Candidatus Rokuibacteriota bacterium]